MENGHLRQKPSKWGGKCIYKMSGSLLLDGGNKPIWWTVKGCRISKPRRDNDSKSGPTNQVPPPNLHPQSHSYLVYSTLSPSRHPDRVHRSLDQVSVHHRYPKDKVACVSPAPPRSCVDTHTCLFENIRSGTPFSSSSDRRVRSSALDVCNRPRSELSMTYMIAFVFAK